MISGLIHAKLNLLRGRDSIPLSETLQKEPFSSDKENKAVQSSHFLISGGPSGTGGTEAQASGNSRPFHKVLGLYLGQNLEAGPGGWGGEQAAWVQGALSLL